MTFTDNEPSITAGAISALAAAVLTVLVSFGIPLTSEQREAVLGLVAVVAPIIVALLIRGHVTPSAKVDAKVDSEVAKALAATVSPPPPAAP
jgi:hypothetical protein